MMALGLRNGAASGGGRKFTVADYYDQHRYTLLDAIEFSGPEEHGTISSNWYDHATGGYANLYAFEDCVLGDKYVEAVGNVGRYRQDVESYEFTNGFTVEYIAHSLEKYSGGTWNYSLSSPTVFSSSTRIEDVNLRGDEPLVGLVVNGHPYNVLHTDGFPVSQIENYYDRLHSFSAVCSPTSIRFFVDGVLRTNLTGTYTMPSLNNRLYQYISIGQYVRNRMGCFRLYDAPLTDEHVLANYAVDKERFGLT